MSEDNSQTICAVVDRLVFEFRTPAGLFPSVHRVQEALKAVVDSSEYGSIQEAFPVAVRRFQEHGLYLSEFGAFENGYQGMKIAQPDGIVYSEPLIPQ